MRMGIMGRKLGMTQIFDANGATVPVTVIDASDCYITQVKTKAKEGYNAIQVACGARKPQNVNKARVGHFKKAGIQAKARIKEIRLDDSDKIDHITAGARVTPAVFAIGDRVDAIALTKGKGFQGVVRRHGFHGADASHGVHEYFRHGGSNGTNTFPGKVLKNKGMPGHLGDAKCTVQNLEVVDVKPEEGLIFLRGPVQGFRNNMLLLRTAKKAKKIPERAWS